jgi:hypothetical protein
VATKISILLYFISFLFGPVLKREQKCHVVSDSREKVLAVIKKDYGSDTYPVYAAAMLKDFEGTPYGGGSNGCPQAHTLVNVKQMDCMTFVENYWAMVFTRHLISQMKDQPEEEEMFAMYVQNLNAIRYYAGVNQRNEDRIQYLTSGFIQLEKAGVLEAVGKQACEPLKRNIHYVSSNKTKFGGFTDWAFIQNKEKEMSQYPYHMFSKNEISKYAELAQDGDLVGLVTTVPGLDVSHCGVITKKGPKVYMTHASSVKKQLVVAQPLEEYLSNRTTISGIVVFRPVFPVNLSFVSTGK